VCEAKLGFSFHLSTCARLDLSLPRIRVGLKRWRQVKPTGWLFERPRSDHIGA
jgi:hypothetical protein